MLIPKYCIQITIKKFSTFSAWCPLKGHIYLNKPAATYTGFFKGEGISRIKKVLLRTVSNTPITGNARNFYLHPSKLTYLFI